MFFAWWSGKGYLVMLYGLIATFCYGLLVNISGGLVPDNRFGWAGALAVAAGITWYYGSRHNMLSRRAAAYDRLLKHRLYYPARHTFFSLPMETSAIIWGAAALFLVGSSAS
jgi:hypothetical protein